MLLALLLSCRGPEPVDSTADSPPADSVTDSAAPEQLSGSWTFDGDTVTVDASVAGELRRYTMTSTHPQRDGGPSERSFSEQAGDPILRSGVLLTDALFAMAVEEARQNAVSQIQDAAFAAPVDCECYQTGELWSWVWTRDIAYATELGLAWLDPERAANSLLFKLSELKPGGQLQIVQDTGTGGSWPVSTDRVAWARGAMAVLRYVDHPALREAAVEAMRNTAELDRRYAYDARDGLYRGETSFLDWRQQSYPRWTAEDVGYIGQSKSLSTNLDHLFLLRALEALTGEEHGAEALAQAIDARFWTGQAYSSYIGGGLDPSSVERRDLLATSLAILDLGTHPEALSTYPHGAAGPPVLWPQAQFTPIYHNRATWPFVTAYAVLAARAADNGASLDANLSALVRGAALNLSHMENLEFVTGANDVEDGDASGPVVNSRRQLWSVAGFLGAVAHGVFGLTAEDHVMQMHPVLPGVWFEPGATLQIGELVGELGGERLGEGQITLYDASDWQNLFAAREPELTLEGEGDQVTLRFTADEGAVFEVWRDGARVAEGVTSPWTDTAEGTACYAARARLVHASLPSQPQCWWGEGGARVRSIQASDFVATGGQWSTNHGRGHYEGWGAPEHSLSVSFTPELEGEHRLQLVYGNGAGGVDTGVTAAVKWMKVYQRGQLLAEGPVLMPQLGDWERWADSSLLPVTLEAGVEATVVLSDGLNMSYLAHYQDYVGGAGGGDAPYNDVNVAELKLLFME